MFDELRKLSRHFLSIKNSPYKRYLIRSTNFNANRMSLIVGQRGVGKTTTLVQSLLDHVNGDIFSEKILYIQTDHFQLATTALYEIAEEFLTMGGKWIAFDEIHKYPEWSKELKSIYDTFPELQILASGSSALEIYKGSHDISRRAVKYIMQGMSFREYLELTYGITFQPYRLEKICQEHEKITAKIIKELSKSGQKIIPAFYQYLKTGYYPFFYELQKNEALYRIILEQNIHTTIESDLVAIFPQLRGSSIRKIKQLLIFLANSVPFTPNWKKIADVLEIGDHRTLKTYFTHLENAGLVRSLTKATKKFSLLETSEKVFLDNPNQMFALAAEPPNKGTLRETFFLCMLSQLHEITLPQKGDFLIDHHYLFEVGGKNKSFQQLHSTKNGYLACDKIEQGAGKKIPLWLFGFLY